MAPIKILVIGNDDADTKKIRQAATQSNINLTEIRTITSAQEAVQTLLSWIPSCVFLDDRLNRSNVLALIKKIKTISPELPVIVLTSERDDKLAALMNSAGVMDVLSRSEVNYHQLLKPFRDQHENYEQDQPNLTGQFELTGNEELIQKIAQLYPNIIYVIDLEKWNYQFHNDKISEVLGYKYQGSKIAFSDIIHEKDLLKLKKHYSRIRHFLKDGKIAEKDFRLKHKDGSEVWILAREVVFKRNENGEAIHVLGTAIDITNRKQSEDNLMMDRTKAEGTARIKADVLSMMSHEIRTPMNAIIGFTDLLLTSNLPPQETLYLNTIKYSADNLIVIINDVLDFSKIEAGKLSLDNFEFDIRDSFDFLYQTFAIIAEQKGITLSFDIDETLPHTVSGDVHRLNQVLINLIGNALKFTEDGFVKFTLEVKKLYENYVEVNIQVADSGIGIAPDKIDFIFDSFTQAHTNSAEKDFGGTGLGLSISSKLTELMDGQLSVESQPGSGSTFNLSLSFPIGTSMPVTEIPADPIFNINGYSIMVADDNLANKLLISHLLDKWQADYIVCSNGSEVLEILGQRSFDLILMDLQMPVMDGITATKIIRNSFHHLAAVPIIACTAEASFSERGQNISLQDFDGILIKPYKKEELMHILHKYLLLKPVY